MTVGGRQMFSMNFAMLFGLGCIALAVLLIAFSRHRAWLVFFFAGMGFWGSLELVREIIQRVFDVSVLSGYLSAFMVFLAFITVAFAIKDHKELKKAAQHKVKCIEHTPVYEDDQRQYS